MSHTFFVKHTQEFYDYYKNNLIYPEIKPNKAHLALAKLEALGKLKAVITQNIDGLHQLAGSKNVYELHGSVLKNSCMNCGAFYDLDYLINPKNCKDQLGMEKLIPLCEKCGEIVKPQVVLYEEELCEETMFGAIRAISNADTLIVGGTSLVVYPAAGLISYFQGSNLVLINKDQTTFDGKADLIIREPIGEVLGQVMGL